MGKYFFTIVLIFGFFVYGFFVGTKKIFPYQEIKSLKQTFSSTKTVKKEPAYDNPIDNKEKANVLIIGDSISIGYTPYVRENLKDKLDVFRILENGRHTFYGKRQMDEWLSLAKNWDVIHFNWGLWDLKYTDPYRKKIQRSTINEYKENLEYLVKKLQKTGAKLIWCTTTPIKEGADSRLKGDEVRYNIAAKEVMEKYDIKINDLYSFAIKNKNDIQLPKHVHYYEEGSEYLAQKVSAEILDALGKK